MSEQCGMGSCLCSWQSNYPFKRGDHHIVWATAFLLESLRVKVTLLSTRGFAARSCVLPPSAYFTMAFRELTRQEPTWERSGEMTSARFLTRDRLPFIFFPDENMAPIFSFDPDSFGPTEGVSQKIRARPICWKRSLECSLLVLKGIDLLLFPGELNG